MMITWMAVLLVAAASFACRLVPLLAADRIRLTPRAQAVLRHAGIGAMTALVLGAVLGHGDGGVDLILVAAIGVAAVLARRGRSMTWVVLAGGAAYATLALLAVVV